MSVILPVAKRLAQLEYLLTTGTSVLKLYSNDLTPDKDTIASDFTEVNGAGYTPKVLTPENWDIEDGSPPSATYPLQTWTFTGPTTAPGEIYGYYILDVTNSLLLSERFPGSVTPFEPELGSIIRLTPKVEFG